MKLEKIFETWIIGDIEIIKVKNAFKDGGEFMYKHIRDGRESSRCSFRLDEQILIALGEKYLGLNNEFAFYTTRMLGMEA